MGELEELRSEIASLRSDLADARREGRSAELLGAIVDSSFDAILSKDLTGTIMTWNPAATTLFGYTSGEAVGRSVRMLIPADRQSEEDEIMRRLVRGERIERFDTVRVKKDGSPVAVSITVSPVRDADGVVIGASKIAHDLTAQHAAEARILRTEAQLRHAQKMEAVGQLAGGVAHDFNNVLSVIMSYVDMILPTLTEGDPLLLDLAEIKRAAERAGGLTRQLLAFSRRQILEPVVLSPGALVQHMERMLRRIVREDVVLTLLLDPGAGRIVADPGQVEQVIMNLVVNAVDAMPHGGRLTIEVSPAVLDQTYAENHRDVTPGDYVMVAITDTGQGMDAATRERIFEPFFTTKEQGKGTGLGLSTVYGIVKQSEGHVWVYSELGRGTTFKVYFPRTEREAEATALARPAAIVRGTETVLVVEDDEQVRRIIVTVLRRSGYHVIVAQNGGEALLIGEQFAGRIDMLITDVVMPHMNGKEVASRLAKVRPGLPVLYISGYTENSIVHHGVLDAGITLLAKPFSPASLLDKVRAVLATRPEPKDT